MNGRDPGDPVLRELREQTRWLRVLALAAVKPQLVAALATDAQRRVYDLSDGIRSTREIAAGASVGAATVSRWWGSWQRQGLMVQGEAHPGRLAHLATTDELGLGPSTEEANDG